MDEPAGNADLVVGGGDPPHPIDRLGGAATRDQLIVERPQGALELIAGERVRQLVEHERRARAVVVE